ncbi:2815_t:CDS:2 [Ambispora gerdemannii]|uniref:2815_t:CDS:1 n=1 Tax=Ambispora gerdemannii TaxID=144530 RepID=A0A9N9G2S1_9GLOM|nr:2815_t:CDS:2 [Ambispora gerdemannii]
MHFIHAPSSPNNFSTHRNSCISLSKCAIVNTISKCSFLERQASWQFSYYIRTSKELEKDELIAVVTDIHEPRKMLLS